MRYEMNQLIRMLIFTISNSIKVQRLLREIILPVIQA